MKKSTRLNNYMNLSPLNKAYVRNLLKTAIDILGCDSLDAWRNGGMEWSLWQAYNFVDCLDSVAPMVEKAQKEVQASTVREVNFPVDICGNRIEDEPYEIILEGPFDIQYRCTFMEINKEIKIEKIN